MLLSLGLVLTLGFITGFLFEKIKIPKIVGMIIIGILIGPSFLNLINPNLINISSYLRQIALMIIITRSGLSLDFNNLKKIGRPAILMCFIPATFEIIGVLIFGPIILGISLFESLLLGSVLAAVSPAIVVPRMINLLNKGYGNNKNIPELVMAGASLDDIYVIVIFYASLSLLNNSTITTYAILQIPISIILGISIGIILGLILYYLFKSKYLNTIIKTFILFSVSLLFMGFEELIKNYISISSLIGIMATGMVLLFKNKNDAKEIEKNYNNLWFFFEILLFVLVGISVDINYALSEGFKPVLLLLISLIFRTLGVLLSISFTKFNLKEKIFIIVSYIPKATVQASIGGIALGLGLDVGSLVLTTAVLSILITAPIGAALIDFSYKKLLSYQKVLK